MVVLGFTLFMKERAVLDILPVLFVSGTLILSLLLVQVGSKKRQHMDGISITLPSRRSSSRILSLASIFV